ncbi:hypothetical protein [Streptomyces sp. NPDC058291]|uniref:hypothetical protein n=1 Tax=Streptomyces sp. NPDC058291 TaxID=3346427 RepID=UPI0036EBF700
MLGRSGLQDTSTVVISTIPALEDADSGLPPEVIAEEIVRDLQAALNEFTAIARSLGGEVDVPETGVE